MDFYDWMLALHLLAAFAYAAALVLYTVLVYSGRSDGGVRDVRVSDLVVTDTRSSASRQIGVVVNGPAPVADVTFAQLTLDATPTPYEGNAPIDDLTLTRVTADGSAVAAEVTP